ncbi:MULTISPECIES: efflux RND transporter periplasmic adaptor subunit [unclassified Duganella]|uniref:efflux RND transporter periplasmic adaptor subunit n=1 Tax=unclassified Duganella TaxID=2636909 RepID=UPI0006FECE4D|nr:MULTISPECIES: efflux RND transporter periplasmic adaptor subunit [unclassified Duganella]KQV53847.1 MFP transporter [Duganella sp. Root336D2]KRB83598.1 MFP transporter [Duganella sp. Root198D2]
MSPQPVHLKSPKRWRLPLIGLLVLGLAGGGWTVMKSQAKPAGDPKAGAAKPAPVLELAGADVAAIDARPLSVGLPLSGSLIPVNQATIKSKVSGQVQEAALREGVSVQEGQVLARLDQADLKARLAQQQAMLEEAQAKLSMAQKNEYNAKALLSQKFISQTSFDTTANAVELAHANVKSASAVVELARIALNDSVIRAPISGIIAKRHVQAGDKVAPDMPVYTIVGLQELTLEAQVPTTDIPRVKIGQEVSFRVDGFAKREFSGKVARINPTTEAGSRAMLVYISVPNADSVLRGGMFAKGNITTERTKEAPMVPLAALREEAGKQVVYLVSNGIVVSQPVSLGLRSEDVGLAEVTAGLDKGANVIISKLEGVKPGAKVKLATPVSTPAAKPAMLAAAKG